MLWKILSLNIVIVLYLLFVDCLSAACPNMTNITGTQLYSLISGNAENLGGQAYKLKDSDQVRERIEGILRMKMKDVKEWVNSGQKLFGTPVNPAKLAVSQIIPEKGPYLVAMGPKLDTVLKLKLLTAQYTPIETKIENACAFRVKVQALGDVTSFSQLVTLVPAS